LQSRSAGGGLNSPLKNVASEDEARNNPAKKRSLLLVNEHSEPDYDAVSSSAVVFQRAVNREPICLRMSSIMSEPVFSAANLPPLAIARQKMFNRVKTFFSLQPEKNNLLYVPQCGI